MNLSLKGSAIHKSIRKSGEARCRSLLAVTCQGLCILTLLDNFIQIIDAQGVQINVLSYL